jgi:aminopeptidase N
VVESGDRLVCVQDLAPTDDLERGSLLDVVSYDLFVDLAGGGETFTSRSEVRFRCLRPGAGAWADLQAAGIRRAVLNGADLDITSSSRPGVLELPQLTEQNTLVVDAEFGYNPAGAGVHLAAGPGGQACVYSKAYPHGAPRFCCCFDQEDLRAPFTVTVNAPSGWSCLANGPLMSRPAAGGTGLWRFAATAPMAPYLCNFCAGPFTGPVLTGEHDRGVPLLVAAHALPPLAALLDSLLVPELAGQSLRYYEHTLGAAYPYGKCDLVFVPGFPVLAFGAPGLITIKEQVLTDPGGLELHLYVATVIAHELAHAWFGGLIDIRHGEDSWLIEALTTWISRAALEQTRPGTDPWAPSVSESLPDHVYARDYGPPIRKLENLIGRQAMFSGLRDLMRHHAYRCLTKDDLIRSWSLASGHDISEWAASNLMPTAEDQE